MAMYFLLGRYCRGSAASGHNTNESVPLPVFLHSSIVWLVAVAERTATIITIRVTVDCRHDHLSDMNHAPPTPDCSDYHTWTQFHHPHKHPHTHTENDMREAWPLCRSLESWFGRGNWDWRAAASAISRRFQKLHTSHAARVYSVRHSKAPLGVQPFPFPSSSRVATIPWHAWKAFLVSFHPIRETCWQKNICNPTFGFEFHYFVFQLQQQSRTKKRLATLRKSAKTRWTHSKSIWLDLMRPE